MMRNWRGGSGKVGMGEIGLWDVLKVWESYQRWGLSWIWSDRAWIASGSLEPWVKTGNDNNGLCRECLLVDIGNYGGQRVVSSGNDGCASTHGIYVTCSIGQEIRTSTKKNPKCLLGSPNWAPVILDIDLWDLHRCSPRLCRSAENQ